jgi:MFS family permease
VFVEFLDWRFIFFVNVPLGAVAAWVLARRFHEDVTRERHRVDYLGAALLAVGTSLLVLGLLEGGVLWPWLSARSVGVLTVGVAAVVAFGLVERRAAEPIIPPWVLRSRLLNTTNVASLSVGVMLIGLTSYIPLYVQGVLGQNALVAGFALAALTLGWPISASSAGRVYLRIGFRRTALVGSAVLLLGAALLLLLSPDSSVWQVGATCFVIGLGMGLVASPTLIASQSAVEWNVRGVVTGTNMFARSMGSALGVAVFGALANASLAGAGGGKVSTTAAGIPASALDSALHTVFVGSAAVAVVLLVAVALMPRTPVPSPS